MLERTIMIEQRIEGRYDNKKEENSRKAEYEKKWTIKRSWKSFFLSCALECARRGGKSGKRWDLFPLILIFPLIILLPSL